MSASVPSRRHCLGIARCARHQHPVSYPPLLRERIPPSTLNPPFFCAGARRRQARGGCSPRRRRGGPHLWRWGWQPCPVGGPCSIGTAGLGTPPRRHRNPGASPEHPLRRPPPRGAGAVVGASWPSAWLCSRLPCAVVLICRSPPPAAARGGSRRHRGRHSRGAWLPSRARASDAPAHHPRRHPGCPRE